MSLRPGSTRKSPVGASDRAESGGETRRLFRWNSSGGTMWKPRVRIKSASDSELKKKTFQKRKLRKWNRKLKKINSNHVRKKLKYATSSAKLGAGVLIGSPTIVGLSDTLPNRLGCNTIITHTTNWQNRAIVHIISAEVRRSLLGALLQRIARSRGYPSSKLRFQTHMVSNSFHLLMSSAWQNGATDHGTKPAENNMELHGIQRKENRNTWYYHTDLPISGRVRGPSTPGERSRIMSVGPSTPTPFKAE